MKRIGFFLLIMVAPFFARAATTIDASNYTAWGANIGWTNWLADSAADGVSVGEFICSGWIYGANVGWINVGNGSPANHIQYQNNSATDFGVNYGIDPTQPGFGILRGYAYGANIGWINFEATGNPRISLSSGNLFGYAYSANCGWISLNDALGKVQTDHIAMGVDSNGNGIPDAWEYLYFGGLLGAGGQNLDADGDGITNLQEYLDGTNPLVRTDALRITAFASNSGGTSSNVTWTSNAARLYIIETNTDLLSMFNPDTIFGTPFAPDAGSSTSKVLVESLANKRFFRVRSVRPLP